MTESAIVEIWNYINEVLEFEEISFSIELLSGRQWYVQVLSVLFPFLDKEWNKIAMEIHSEEAAIDRMLLLLAQEGALPEEYLAEIKGKDVIDGNQETILTLVQILNEFVEQALEEGQEGGNENHQFHENQQEMAQEQSADYIHKTQEQPLVRNRSPMVTIKDSEVDERKANSVLGNNHEFQQEEASEEFQYEQPDFDKLPQGFNIHGGTMQTGSSSQPKFMKMTNYKNQDQEDQPFEVDDDNNYLNQKLNKCKSQEQFKNIQRHKPKGKKSKKVRMLVPHPPIPKTYNKAKTAAQKQLTKDVKSDIYKSRSKFDKQNFNMTSPVGKDYIDKKKRQANYFTSPKNQYRPKKSHIENQSTTNLNINKLKKLLKWKQNNLKKQQRQIQQDLEMKVQLKKQTYIKKINKLIMNLEKEKIIESKKEQRQRQRRQKQKAQQRFLAIQQQYRDQMAMLNSRNSAVKKIVSHTDHRQIIENLQKELKRENEKQVNALKTKMRRQQAQLDDDLQVLQREIIKAYKRN